MIQYKMSSPIGSLYLVASSKGLKGIFFQKQNLKMVTTLSNQIPEEKNLASAARQLAEYFAGKRTQFSMTFDVSGTEFQKKVWSQLQKIPYGETKSYFEIARAINNPKAVRAVGTANGKNPLGIVVPCHRVIAKDGTLGGYAGGLRRKKHLLSLEKNIALS